MFKRLSLVVVALTLVLPSIASAWNDVGHLTVAEIAWQKLSPEDRAAVTAILKQHPSYTQMLTADVPQGVSVDEWAFIRAATWPDWIRPSRPGDKEFKPTTITRYHHGPWHYINLPFVAEKNEVSATAPAPGTSEAAPTTQPGGKDLDVVTALEANRDELANASTDAVERAVALSWLEHLTGDIHQPLHASTMYSKQFPSGDKGGNDQAVRTESGVMNLHSLWDELLGTSPSYRMVAFLADDIIADPRCDVTKRREYADDKTPASWAAESHEYADSFAYLDGKLRAGSMKDVQKTASAVNAAEVPAVPPMYMENARDVARVRVSLAGARLAAVIHAALAK